MSAPAPLYKSTIVIWSSFDPTQVELSDLAYAEDQGSAICTRFDSMTITVPLLDPDYDEAVEEFFTQDLDDGWFG